jgi:hypothetical protein
VQHHSQRHFDHQFQIHGPTGGGDHSFLETKYVGQVNADSLVDHAIEAVMYGLDPPHSLFSTGSNG